MTKSMEEKKYRIVDKEEIYGFLRSKGIHLTGEARRIFEKKLEENPIDIRTFTITKRLSNNKFFKRLLDLSFVSRIKKRMSNPVLKLIEKKRKELKKHRIKKGISYSELEKVFYDEDMWEPFYPVPSEIGEGGIVVKVMDKGENEPYIGLLRARNFKGFHTITLMTTKREKFWNMVTSSKFWKLKEFDDIEKKKYIGEIEAEFVKYIYQRQELKIRDN